jgi:hypothetical protein
VAKAVAEEAERAGSVHLAEETAEFSVPLPAPD